MRDLLGVVMSRSRALYHRPLRKRWRSAWLVLIGRANAYRIKPEGSPPQPTDLDVSPAYSLTLTSMTNRQVP